MPEVSIVVPVLGRPERAGPLIDSIRLNTDVSFDVWFVCTEGDEAQINAVREIGVPLATIPWQPGDYARKVNLGYRLSTAPWIFHAADDLSFHPGWASKALAHAADGVGVIGTNDLGNPMVVRGEHATHSLVARWYADEHGTIDGPGQVLYEGYHHCWVDNELVGTAKARGAFVFAADSIVEHNHWVWRKGSNDGTYDLGQREYRQDQLLFGKRRRLWARGARTR